MKKLYVLILLTCCISTASGSLTPYNPGLIIDISANIEKPKIGDFVTITVKAGSSAIAMETFGGSASTIPKMSITNAAIVSTTIGGIPWSNYPKPLIHLENNDLVIDAQLGHSVQAGATLFTCNRSGCF